MYYLCCFFCCRLLCIAKNHQHFATSSVAVPSSQGWADDPVWLKGGLPSLWSKKPFKYHALSGLPETVRSNFVNVNAFHADSLARSEKGVLVFQLEDSCRTSVMVLFDPNWQPFFWNTKISREIHVHYDGKSSLIFRIESTMVFYLYIWISGIYRPKTFRKEPEVLNSIITLRMAAGHEWGTPKIVERCRGDCLHRPHWKYGGLSMWTFNLRKPQRWAKIFPQKVGYVLRLYCYPNFFVNSSRL